MKLVVGLGNPGTRVRRHPAQHRVRGASIALAARLGWIVDAGEFDRLAKTKFDGLALDGTSCSSRRRRRRSSLLLKPMTYMNLSGRRVQAAMAFYQLDAGGRDGRARRPRPAVRQAPHPRPAAVDGGHNGLKDIERALGTSEYPRLRIGIDPPPPRVPRTGLRARAVHRPSSES